MKRLTNDKFIKKVNYIQHDQYKILSKYRNEYAKITVKCKKCGRKFDETAKTLMTYHIGKNCYHHINGNQESVANRIFKESKGTIIMIGKYNGAKNKTEMQCKVCNYKWSTEPYVVYKGHGCPQCSGKAKITTISFKKYLNRYAKDYKLIGLVISSKKKVKILHKECGNLFYMTPHNFIVSEERCPYSASKRRGDSNAYSFKKMNQILKLTTGNRYKVSSHYTRASKKAVCFDNKCKRHFISIPSMLSRNETGCPFCATSKGEKAIRIYLIDHRVSFKEQVKFSNCRNKRSLPFDFAVYKNNKLLYLIEFQVIQHYKHIELFDKTKCKIVCGNV